MGMHNIEALFIFYFFIKEQLIYSVVATTAVRKMTKEYIHVHSFEVLKENKTLRENTSENEIRLSGVVLKKLYVIKWNENL